MDVKSVFPLDLPPFVLDVLVFNKNASFRELVTWIDLAELARRMIQTKDHRIEQLEREAWLQVCAHGTGEAEDRVVRSIFLSNSVATEWFSAGVQTLLFSPAFQRLTLTFLKGAQRDWFPRDYCGADIVLQLLRMGVYCNCENADPPLAAQGVVFIKRRRVDEEDVSALVLAPQPERWKACTMRKAWRDFIVGRWYADEHVLENIRMVQDPDMVR
jgi:hypothetical protein